MHEKKTKAGKKKKSAETKSPKKTPTHYQTLELFLQGNSLGDIAGLRSLSLSTIESHMARLLEEKKIDILDLMPRDRYEEIMAAIEEKNEISGLNALRQELGEGYSFGELKMVLAANKPISG